MPVIAALVDNKLFRRQLAALSILLQSYLKVQGARVV
jgi:hypothetical protein